MSFIKKKKRFYEMSQNIKIFELLWSKCFDSVDVS